MLKESNASDSASQMLSLARQIDAEAQNWAPKLLETGEFASESFDRMVQLRQQLLSMTPHGPLDALILVGAAQSLASFMLNAASTEGMEAQVQDMAHDGAVELLVALNSLRSYLEPIAGYSLETLGLFRGGPGVQ